MKNNVLTKEEEADSNNLRNNTEAINVEINKLNSDYIKQLKCSEFSNSSKELNNKASIPVVPPKYSDNCDNVSSKKYIFKIDKGNNDIKNKAITFINKSKKMHKEKIYQEVSLSKRRKLVNFYNNNNCTLKKIADMHKINYSTAKSIMRRFRQEEKSQEDKKISNKINLISNDKHFKNIFLITKINKETNEVLRDYNRFNKNNICETSTVTNDSKNKVCKGKKPRISYRNNTNRINRKHYFKLIKNKLNIKANDNNTNVIIESSSNNVCNENKEKKCLSKYLIKNIDKIYDSNLNLDNNSNVCKSTNKDIDLKRNNILNENQNISRLLDNFKGDIIKNKNSFLQEENIDNKLCNSIESINHLLKNNNHIDKKENNDLSKYSTGIHLNDIKENEINDYNNYINKDNRFSNASKTNINQLFDKHCYSNEEKCCFSNEFCNIHNNKPDNHVNIDKLKCINNVNYNNITNQDVSNTNLELPLVEPKCKDKVKQEIINNSNNKANNSNKNSINALSNNINLNTNNATIKSLLQFVKLKQDNKYLSNSISTIDPSISKQSKEALFLKLKNLLMLNDKYKANNNSIHTSTINQSNAEKNISNNNKNDNATNTIDYPKKVKSLLDKLLLNTVENSIINKYLEKTDSNKNNNSSNKETITIHSNIKNSSNKTILVSSDNMMTAYLKHINSNNRDNLSNQELAIHQSNNRNIKEKDLNALSKNKILSEIL